MNINKKTILLVTLTACLALSSSAFAYTNVNDQLDDGIDLYDDERFKNATELLLTLVESRDFRRLDNTEKSLALSHLIYSLMEQGEARKALNYSNTLVAHAKYAYKKQSDEYLRALFLKARVLYRAGKPREAIRISGEMQAVLTRMGNEYGEEMAEAKSIPSQVRRKEWDDDYLRKDLSDFYTKCEEISSGDKIPVVTRIMHKYKLVGKDYKPTRKLKKVFKNTYIKRARENSSDRANRIIFIPDEKHLEDWCVVYPDGYVVDRAVLVPPED